MTPETVPCPGCSVPLGVEEEVCPRCRRPRDTAEMDRSREELRRRAEARRRRPRRIALAVLLLAVAAGLYQRRRPALEVLASVRADLARQLDEAAHPKKSGKPLSPMAKNFVEVMTRGGAQATGDLALAPAATATAPAAPPAPPAPRKLARHPAPPPASEYPSHTAKRVYGVVFDLMTAEAVPGAALAFKTAGQTYRATTDGEGRYIIDVLGACMDKEYAVEASADGFRAGQLEDVDPSYLDRTPEERRSTLEQLAPSDLEPFALRCPRSATVVPLDIALLRAAAP